jgi:hypothetical protein
MKQGHLSKYFEGVAAKRLSAVEIRPERSNQHEFNGASSLKRLLVKPFKRRPARFLYLSDDEDEFITADSWVSWYDSRRKRPTRTEHRLYYPSTPVSEAAREGDLLVVGKRHDGKLLVLIARAGTTAENQIKWLFGLELDNAKPFSVVEIKDSKDTPLDIAAKFVLEELGIEVEPANEFLDLLLNKFPNGFPTTQVFSTFARDSLKDVSSLDDPDAALVAWIDREEVLFRTLERHLVADRIRRGFGSDVDSFISYSLSIQNRRKARAGYALENHLESILKDHKLRYARGGHTEGKSQPDFLFPGELEYRDLSFAETKLKMLGVKSSCKERWRQVLAEAKRIKSKHLLTLEPGISAPQTDEMREKSLHLVLPRSIHNTYAPSQKDWLMSVVEFIDLVKRDQ